MKKRIFSVVLGLLFIGLLAFNFALTDSEVDHTPTVSLEIVAATAMAQGEGGNPCILFGFGCIYNGLYYPDWKEPGW